MDFALEHGIQEVTMTHDVTEDIKPVMALRDI